jgi:uncharacterized protein YdeI (YjbR/CyaY-like superfamily)
MQEEKWWQRGSGHAEVSDVKPKFFHGAEDFRRWLQRHHASAPELLVGFYKLTSGRPSRPTAESVDEALCFGWIDGIRRRVDPIRCDSDTKARHSCAADRWLS